MALRYKFWKELACIIVITIAIIKLFHNIRIKNGDNNLKIENLLSNKDLGENRFKKNDKVEETTLDSNEGKYPKQDLQARGDAAPLSPKENELLYRAPIDVALIFTNAVDNAVIQFHLGRAVTTLLKNAHAPVRLHIVSDEDSFSIGSKIINEVQEANQWDTRHVKLVYVSAVELANEVGPVVKILQDYFTNKSHSKYRDFLFFFSLFFDRLLPGITNIILMDIDIVVKGDIAELHSHFSRFTESQIIGLSHELSPVYRHILSTYRSKNPDTKLGSTVTNGGFPGYNSGVLLINLPRLRQSPIMKSYQTRQTLDAKAAEYNFRGHLGDQDLYTLIALDHPEIFYTLPCSWNRQLCKWWNIKLYEDVFDEYFQCAGDVKILHGNCKTEIPPEEGIS